MTWKGEHGNLKQMKLNRSTISPRLRSEHSRGSLKIKNLLAGLRLLHATVTLILAENRQCQTGRQADRSRLRKTEQRMKVDKQVIKETKDIRTARIKQGHRTFWVGSNFCGNLWG